MLDSHPSISAGPETQFLADLSRIVGSYWHMIEHFGFDRDYWHRKIAHFFDSFQMEYASKRGKTRWCDKTPRYTTCLDFINELFPDAQFVHMIRNGRDVVASHRDRWGYWRAVKATKVWREFVTRGRTFGNAVPSDRYVEVRYEDLVGDPKRSLQIILDFLGEPWDPGVLRFDRIDHGMPHRYTAFTNRRREEGGEKSAIYRSRLGTGAKELDPVLKTFFWICSRSLMRELGYR